MNDNKTVTLMFGLHEFVYGEIYLIPDIVSIEKA